MRSQRLRAQHVSRGCFDSRQDYSEGEFSRSGDEVRGRVERAVAAAAAAAGLAAGLEPYPAAAVGPGLPAGALPGGLPLCVSRVRAITVP